MNTPVSTRSDSLSIRTLRLVALFGLAGTETFFVAIAFLAFSSKGKAALGALFFWGDTNINAPQWATGFAIAVFGLFVFLFWLGRRLTWRALAVSYLAVTPILIYMSVDDAALLRPLTLEEFAPSFPGAETSYAAFMRYGKDHALGREFKDQLAPLVSPPYDPKTPEIWQKKIVMHRTGIEAYWRTTLAPVWAWWTELDTFEQIGDLTPGRRDAEIPAFAPIRSLTRNACVIASLQALDGRGDEAIGTLVPLISVARKLQPSSRTLVRTMIAIVIEKQAIITADFILDHAVISPESRARLAAVLAAPGGGEIGARRLIVEEYCFHLASSNGLGLGDLTAVAASDEHYPWAVYWSLNALGPLLYNQRSTFNQYAELTAKLEDIVGRRQLDQLDPTATKWIGERDAPHFKNFGGSLYLSISVPAYNKVSQSFWDTQDLRAALLVRVRTP